MNLYFEVTHVSDIQLDSDSGYGFMGIGLFNSGQLSNDGDIAIWEMTIFPMFQQDLNFNEDIQHYSIAGVNLDV